MTGEKCEIKYLSAILLEKQELCLVVSVCLSLSLCMYLSLRAKK